MEEDFGFPIGARVFVKEAFGFTATVVGHKFNSFGVPLIVVHDDARKEGSTNVYYPCELDIIG